SAHGRAPMGRHGVDGCPKGDATPSCRSRDPFTAFFRRRWARVERPGSTSLSADLLEGVGIAELLDLAAGLAECRQVVLELLAGEGGVLLAGTAGPTQDGAVVLPGCCHQVLTIVEQSGSLTDRL